MFLLLFSVCDEFSFSARRSSKSSRRFSRASRSSRASSHGSHTDDEDGEILVTTATMFGRVTQ